ncbi:MAG: GtrA family protein [Acidimicrobiales bacterium]
MRNGLKRLWDFCHTPRGRRMFRYTAVSASSTVVSFVVLTIVYGVLKLWTEVPSVLFANVLAGVWSYNMNRRWAWGKAGRSHVLKEVLPFCGMNLAGLTLSLLAADWAHDFGNSHHLHHIVRTGLLVSTNLAAWGSLWVLKFLLFNQLFRVSHPPSVAQPREVAVVAQQPDGPAGVISRSASNSR